MATGNPKKLFQKEFIRSVSTYTFTNFFAKAVSFLLVFIFTDPRYITPDENGLLALFSNSMVFLMPFITLGIIHSTSSDFYKLDKKSFDDQFTSGFVLPAIATVISCIVLYFFRVQLFRDYGFPSMFVLLIPLITFLIFCNEQLLSLCRNNKEPAVFLKASMLRMVSDVAISLFLVFILAWRWEGRVAGVLIAQIAVAVYGVYYFVKKGYLSGTIRKKYIIKDLHFALPIIIMQLSIFCMSASDRFFLSHFSDDNNESVGIYNLVITFASTIIILCTAFLQYIFPKIFSNLSSAVVNYKSIRNHFFIYTAVMSAGFLLIIILTPVVYHYFINERYHSALNHIYLLTGGYFLWTIAYFFFSFLLYYKKKTHIVFLSLCCIIVSISFKYFFIKEWNMQGAAIANICSYLVVLFLTLIFTRFWWRKLIKKENPEIDNRETEQT